MSMDANVCLAVVEEDGDDDVVVVVVVVVVDGDKSLGALRRGRMVSASTGIRIPSINGCCSVASTIRGPKAARRS